MTKPILLAWVWWLGIVFLIQGIYVFRAGIVIPFFLQSEGRQRVSNSARVSNGLIFVASGIVLVSLAARVTLSAFKHVEVSGLWFPLAFACGGFVFFVKPNTLFQVVRTSYPDLQESASALVFSRFIGAALLFLGLLFLTSY